MTLSPTRQADIADGIPEMIARKVEDYWKENTVMPQLVRRDLDMEYAEAGKTVNVTAISELTVQEKAAGTDYDAERVTSSDTEVTLDQHNYIGFLIEDIARFLTKPDYQQSLMDQGVKKLIEEVESDLLARYADITTNSVGTAGTDMTADIIVDARKKLTDSKVPTGNRSLVASSKDIAALLKLEKFTSSAWAEANGAALKEASLGRKYGFDIYESQGIKSGGSPTAYYNLAFHRDAFVLASRPMLPPDSKTGVDSRLINADGVMLRVMVSYEHDKGGYFVTIELLYGVKTLREEGACLITT